MATNRQQIDGLNHSLIL